MYKIDKNAHFERLEARYNKLSNFDFTDVKYCTNEKDEKNDKIDKSVKFSHDIEGIDGDMKDFVDITTLVDGTQRNKSIFTNAILLWYNSLSKIDFFDGACKKYVDSGSSVYWDEWLIDIIERLENGEKVILWGNLGGNKKLYPLSDKRKIVAFHDAWIKYNIITRVAPIPFNIANYFWGTTEVDIWVYILATFIGVIPWMVFEVYTGSIVKNINKYV